MSHQPHAADIGYLLNRATRQLRLSLADELAETGLTPQQAAVLLAVARSEGVGLTPSTIAATIDTDQATTSGLLGRLCRDGWLLSTPNPDDGRSRLFRLTDKSEASLQSVLAAADAVSGSATACLTDEEGSMLRELLLKLCASDAPAARKGLGL